MAGGLVGSEILKIAADIRELGREGVEVCNLTVGDFDPGQFPIPTRLSEDIQDALAARQTNYPPSNGMLELREAVQRFYGRSLGLSYPVDSVLIASGARPCIYAAYRALVDPGETVAYPVPSWNNNHYCHMIGAKPLELVCGPKTRFLPTGDAVLEALPKARLLCLNSPLNPTGTAFDHRALQGICEAVLAENRRREQAGERPLYLLYDQIYWMLTFEGVEHLTPPQLIPELARWTIFVDGISKAFAATGVRVGWAVGPVDVIKRMSAILGHVGAWAPRAEQRATVGLLDDPEAIAEYHAGFKSGLLARLRGLYRGFAALAEDGLPVEAIPPMGAIYLTVRIAPFGKRTPDGELLETNEDVRRYLLDAARVGVVPFQAFGVGESGQGWFRLSVGAVSEQDIAAALPRVAAALKALR
ncbi:aminotransferase class I/II-fold pyridoxal phosphate-dependent enzyme [Pseudenhygromyxa sp. WMMC2535]|uniref:aminotransferase class I/II-fold pyridoxal phosphate-dependent enzyme n=1 Tax=Pseudenhygromyxa sp. WMMC2535 TaxID=2712867 RepID=UPI001557504C|nr:aminotransferase class I/II-fold pyridoxal phosphate-dependent enzyme [Pseudenhygromyxa sp. WMMC2535]